MMMSRLHVYQPTVRAI